MGHDPANEIVYNSMVMRFMGDISIEQTTVQSPDGINYRIGNSDSGSWYYARDEVYQYENPFSEDEGGEGGDGESMMESPNAMSSSIITHLVGRIIGHCHMMMESTRPKE